MSSPRPRRIFDDIGAFGLSVTALYTDEMKVRTPLQPEGTGETFYVGNYRFGLSYARFLTDRVTFGLTMSYINMKLYQEFTADAFSLDIAVMYVSDFRGFRFALEIADFGSNIQYVNESYPLPTNFQFGLAMNAIDGDDQKLPGELRGRQAERGRTAGAGGRRMELPEDRFSSAEDTGSTTRRQHGPPEPALRSTLEGLGLRADYSYSDYKTLGGSHRIGIGVSF